MNQNENNKIFMKARMDRKDMIDRKDMMDIKRKIDLKEGFDGIRKSNSRLIFGILLGIIILDFAFEYFD